MTARVDHGVTSGTFSLDGQTFDVDNNVWVVGDDTESRLAVRLRAVETDIERSPLVEDAVLTLSQPGEPGLAP